MTDDQVRTLTPFIERMAQRLVRQSTIDWRDIASEGWIAALSAHDRFDAGRNHEAAAGWRPFVLRRAKGGMLDALRRGSWPRGARRFRAGLQAASVALEASGRHVTPEALAQHLGWTVRQVLRRQASIVAYETRPTHTKDTVIAEAELSASCTRAVGMAEEDRIAALDGLVVRGWVRRLGPRDQDVVRRYYWRGETMKEIGRVLGVNESRVCQIHARVLRVLRQVAA